MKENKSNTNNENLINNDGNNIQNIVNEIESNQNNIIKPDKNTHTYKNGDKFKGKCNDKGSPLDGIMIDKDGNKFYYIDGRKFEDKFYKDVEGRKQLITVNEKEGGRIEGEFTNGEPFYATRIDNNGNKSPATLRMVDGKIRILEGIIKYKDGAKFYGKLDEFEAPSEGTMVYEQGSRYDRYIGTFEEWKKLNGKMFYRNGDVFEGTFKEGQPYNGILTSANKVDLFYYMDGVKLKVEEPVFVNKIFERNLIGGKFTCTNGDKFEGEFKDNQISKGKFTYANGDVFEGTFTAGKPYNGKLTLANNGGVLYYIDGFKLTVENPVFDEPPVFNDSRDIIRGSITFQNGNRFEGTFKNGKPDKGTMTYANGDRFSGQFTMSQIPDVEQPDETMFYNDDLVALKLVPGDGKMTYSNGHVFEGMFKNEKPFNGKMTYSSGDIFEGEFKNGIRYDGELTFKHVADSMVKKGGVRRNGNLTLRNCILFSGIYDDDGNPFDGQAYYNNGDIFEGKFGRFKGEEIIADTGIFEGEIIPYSGLFFKSIGVCYYENGNKYLKKVKKDGQLHQITMFDVFGNKFIGKAINGIAVEGKMIYINGDEFEGKFDKHGKPLEGKIVYNNGDIFEGKIKGEQPYTGLFFEKKNWFGHTKYYYILGERYEVYDKKKKAGTNSSHTFEGEFNKKNYSLKGKIFFKDGSQMIIEDTKGTDKIVDCYGDNTFEACFQRPDGLVMSGLFGAFRDKAGMLKLYHGVGNDLKGDKTSYEVNGRHCDEKQGFCILKINDNTTVRVTKDGQYFLVPSDQKSGVSQDGTAHGEMFVMDSTLTEIYAIVEFDTDGKPIKATNNIGSNYLKENTLSSLQEFLGNRNYKDLISKELPKKLNSLEDEKKQVQEEEKDQNEIIFEGEEEEEEEIEEEEEEEINLYPKKAGRKDKNEIILEGEEEEEKEEEEDEEMNLSSKKTDRSIMNEKLHLIKKNKREEKKGKTIQNDKNDISLKDDNKQKRNGNKGIG